MKKIIIYLILLVSAINAHAQKLEFIKCEFTNSLDAQNYPVFYDKDKYCALVKVQLPLPDVTFIDDYIIGEPEFKNKNEWWVYMAPGAKKLSIHANGFPTLDCVFDSKVDSKATYKLEIKVIKPTPFKFYADLGFSVGGTMAPELAIGAYLGGFNVELNAMVPIAKAERIYWNSLSAKPAQYDYKPSLAFGGRIGYGIIVGEKFRITPQAGLMLMMVKETPVSDSANKNPAKGANCASLAIGCKLQYLVSKSFTICITPEYKVPILQSNGFKAMSEVSNNIKKWNNGIGVKLAVGVEF